MTIWCKWTGIELKPRNLKQCADLVVGQVYPLELEYSRSRQSHEHQFAWLQDAFDNLPEDIAEHFPSVDHLRKFALIRTGYRDERSIVCDTRDEALKVAAFVRPIDPLSWVVVGGSTVTVYTAKSQSMRAMGGAEFQRSKQAVLEYVSRLIGVDSEDLRSNAGKAA